MSQSHFLIGLVVALALLLAAVTGPFLARRNRPLFRVMILVSAVLVIAAVVTLIITRPPGRQPGRPRVSDAQVQSILSKRCSACHSRHPTEPGYTHTPAGLILETPQQVRDNAHRVYRTTVASRFMPLGNITDMTSAERTTLGHWIDQQ